LRLWEGLLEGEGGGGRTMIPLLLLGGVPEGVGELPLGLGRGTGNGYIQKVKINMQPVILNTTEIV